MEHRHKNLFPHEPHGLFQVLQWKLGLRRSTAAPGCPSFGEMPVQLKPVSPRLDLIRSSDPARVQVTWIGHATFLLQLAGMNLMVDPVFTKYCAPFPMPFCRRLFPPGLSIGELPSIDAVLITPNHYDHLDRKSVLGLGKATRFLVPDGLRSWFLKRGFAHCEEFRWWEMKRINPGIDVACLPAQHFLQEPCGTGIDPSGADGICKVDQQKFTWPETLAIVRYSRRLEKGSALWMYAYCP